MGNKTFDFSSKKKDFLPRIGIFGQFWPGLAGLFSALLVGRLVVVVRGLYLARHLFTLFVQPSSLVVAFESLKMWLFCILCHLIMEHRCMTQPGSDEMVYRVLLEHANNSAKSSEQSVESETNSASDLGGDEGSNTSHS